jgi:hypothetical protein
MCEVPSSAAKTAHDGLVDRPVDASVSLREGVYRYFFYDWLFRDANGGSDRERALALRHNRDQARWLPVYIRRWIVAGAAVLGFEALSEHVLGSAVLSAALLVILVLVVLFLLVSVVCWVFLRSSRAAGR